ncbi:MAG: 3-phosphoshikimate 1-carboxyvinyltransferase, partial [Candidatus Ranarchaeia archaeon]
MMDLTIKSSELSGEVEAPPSKSYSHRALITGFMTKKRCILNNLLSSDDVDSTINGLKQLGAKFVRGGLTVIHSPEPTSSKYPIDCENSGSTLRLLTGVCSVLEGVNHLTGSPQLSNRPMNPLTNAIMELGGKIEFVKEQGFIPFNIEGPRKPGEVTIDGSQGSQFISALLISSPQLNGKTTIHVENPKSQPYIDMTVEVMRVFAYDVKQEGNTYIVGGNQEGRATSYIVPGDWSSAAYIGAAGAVAGEVTLKNLQNDAQGDKAIIDVIQRMGGKIIEDENGIQVKSRQPRGVTVDCANTPDLVPAIAALGALANGQTIIKNSQHLRLKETNRIENLALQFQNVGVDVEPTEDGLIITGPAV